MILQEALYNLSKKVVQLRQRFSGLTTNLVFQYSILVDNSPVRFNCVYARTALKVTEKDREIAKLRKQLIDLRADCDTLLEELDSEWKPHL